MKIQYLLIAPLFLCVAQCNLSSTYAEGHRDFNPLPTPGKTPTTDAANGVNRVIRTDGSLTPAVNGYTGFQGHMDLKYIMPYDRQATNAQLYYPANINSLNNKASMYTGGRFVDSSGTNDVEMDAGIQYEPASFSVKGLMADSGWSMFLRSASVTWMNPHTYDNSLNSITHAPLYPNGKPWRGGKNNAGIGSIEGQLLLEVTSQGYGHLVFGTGPNALEMWGVTAGSINLIPTAAHPFAPWIDATHQPLVMFNTGNQLRNSYVKRVTALTRANGSHSELDGSKLIGTWADCQVFDPVAGTWGPWTWQATQQGTNGPTGYDAPDTAPIPVNPTPAHPLPFNPLAFNHRYNGLPTWLSTPIVSFVTSNTDADKLKDSEMRAQNTDEVHEPLHSDRYQNETTVIDLGTLARPMGGILQ